MDLSEDLELEGDAGTEISLLPTSNNSLKSKLPTSSPAPPTPPTTPQTMAATNGGGGYYPPTPAGTQGQTLPQTTLRDWRENLQSASIITKWECLLDNELFTDFTFLIGESHEPVKCHRLVLKMQSKHLEDVLSHEKHSMEIRSCSVPVFRKFLKYLYTDTLDVTAEEAMDLLLLALKFHLTVLQMKCGRIVMGGIDMDNAAGILRKAEEIGDRQLSLKAQEFIILNSNQILITEGFKEISSAALLKLLQHNRKLWNSSEVRILEGVVAWASAECLRQGKSITGPNQYIVAHGALALIDFKKFSAMEFTTHVVKQKLLPAQDMLDLQSELIEKEMSNMRIDEGGNDSQPSLPFSPQEGAISSPRESIVSSTYELQDDKHSDSSSETELNSDDADATASASGPRPVDEEGYHNLNFYKLVRYSCSISDDWKSSTGDGTYKISFSCSSPIDIIGVSLFAFATSAKLTNVSLQILSFDGETTYLDFVEQFILPKDGGEFDVMFEKPVHIAKADWYTIVAGVNCRVHPYGTGGKKYYEVDVGHTRVEFSFKNSDGVKGASHVRGQLPQIYFTVPPKHTSATKL